MNLILTASALRTAADILDRITISSREINNPVHPVGWFFTLDGLEDGPYTSGDLAQRVAVRQVLRGQGVEVR